MANKKCIPRNCEHCGRPFLATQWKLSVGMGRFCARPCHDAHKTRPLAVRFWEKVDRRGPDECWPWKARTTGSGYGHITNPGGDVIAHRVAWVLTNGPIPDSPGHHGTCVCHKCDNPPCCNPAHLFLGTMRDNIQDCVTKGRRTYAHGVQNPGAKLSDDDVRRIRALASAGHVQRDLAKQFGVDPMTVSLLVRRKTWAHVS